eukprot:scaffold288214_cov32-Tisochrysis_lutea.AAC.2
MKETHEARSGVLTCCVITPLTHACIGKMLPAPNDRIKYSTTAHHSPSTLSPSMEIIVAQHMIASAKRRQAVGFRLGNMRKPMVSHTSELVSCPRVAASWKVAKPSGSESKTAATT